MTIDQDQLSEFPGKFGKASATTLGGAATAQAVAGRRCSPAQATRAALVPHR